MYHPSVPWHLIPMRCSRWSIIWFGQKKPIKVQFFRLSSRHFWNRKVSVYSNFASLFSTMKENSYVFLQRKPYIPWTKRAHRKDIFRLLSGWVKLHQITHVIFETTSQFFFKLCIILQCHERELFCNFLAKTLCNLDK